MVAWAGSVSPAGADKATPKAPGCSPSPGWGPGSPRVQCRHPGGSGAHSRRSSICLGLYEERRLPKLESKTSALSVSQKMVRSCVWTKQQIHKGLASAPVQKTLRPDCLAWSLTRWATQLT
ncbi:BRISC and BRCA1-A complex member 1 [Galemys pyrenaicus]|uniref:BRISC and BRCA1-A complex member 1 n=1 Tax=Galemys pyrenaicus TaxID=202257 RepID=A0A8J6DNM6_GALPY|nr:BRISC and BRCA1-A complex member 1 [Galemys pyrenaicus]